MITPLETFKLMFSRLVLGGIALSALTACSTSDKIKPGELPANPASLAVRPLWTQQVGAVQFSLEPRVVGQVVTVASSEGVVAALDVGSGRELWRTSIGAKISAGVGSDGKLAAVVNNANEVVALEAGKVIWRQQLGAQSYTPPLVAGARVFVVTADRTVTALDGQSGRKLWSQPRTGEALVLKQAGVLLAVGDTLVLSQGGRLAGLSPANGAVRWEAPLATSRGTNDVERLIDLVGPVSRVGNVVCARAFQSQVGCVDASRGQVLWSKKSVGSVGVHGDDKWVVGTESDSKLMAWNRADGERVWTQDSLLHRGLGVPLLVGKTIAVGDEAGMLHLLSSDTGKTVNRVSTDGSAIQVPPVALPTGVMVVTRSGAVMAFGVGQ
jgi:outer membrane assembly lipoprotein YfgL